MVDSWDVLALAGAALVVSGVALWSGPAALVLSGASLLGLYYLRERGFAVPAPTDKEKTDG